MSLRIGITSASFHFFGNVPVRIEQSMISVRGPKMTGRQSLIKRVLNLSGPGALLSSRDIATWRTSSHVTVLRLKSSSLGGRSTLISSGIAKLFFLARHKEASTAFLPTAAKNWLN